uniref:Arginine and serine rich coiled-coil 1 n=1 Tax=Leptobrachium leishanense TaxID=445787 RepID=A0A8C5N1Y5_9ANUR
MGRHSSDSEEDSRSRKKKKHRKRSSSSSSSDSRSYSRKKSGRNSRSRSREAHSSSRSYDRRRKHRSSSGSSYSSKRKRSRSKSRDRGKSRKSHRSRSSRSRSRHRQRSRSSERSSRRKSRSRSRDRDRGKVRAKAKTRDKDRGKVKEQSTSHGASINLKAGLEHLPPAEQAKARLQMVLQAADQFTLLEQAKRVKEIEAIESDSFIPQIFRSSRDTKTLTETSEVKHEAAILGTSTVDLFEEEKNTEVASIPSAIKYLDDNSLAHPNLYIEQKEAEEKWYKRLMSLRQERLMGSPVA